MSPVSKIKVLLFLALGSFLARAAPTLVQVSQIIYRADGTPAKGSVVVSWQTFIAASGDQVLAGSKTVLLSATGLLSVQLVANVGASPAGTAYRVAWTLDLGSPQNVSWIVPASGPVTVAAIQSTTIPQPSSVVALTQLSSGGATNGQCLIYNSTSGTWGPSSSCGGGGGGNPPFGNILSGTNTSMAAICGSGCSIGLTGSGTIVATSLTALTGLPSMANNTVLCNVAGSSAPATACPITTLALPNTQIFVGNVSNVPTAVTLSGAATIANNGVLTLATVNSNVGACGDATHVGVATYTAQGLATACTPVSITGGSGTPGGSNNDIQVNNSGAFAGGRGTLDGSGNLTVAGTIQSGTGSTPLYVEGLCSTAPAAPGTASFRNLYCNSSTNNLESKPTSGTTVFMVQANAGASRECIATIVNDGSSTRLPCIGAATTDTLTNKTFDTAGAGNALKVNGTTLSAVSGTGAVCLASGSACAGGGGGGTMFTISGTGNYWLFGEPQTTTPAGNFIFAPNATLFWEVSLPAGFTFTKLLFKQTTHESGAHFAWGIYDSSCALVAQSATLTSSASSPISETATFSSTAPTTGTYFLALSSDSPAGTIAWLATDPSADGADIVNQTGSGAFRVFNANPSTGTTTITLPSTCGSRTARGFPFPVVAVVP